MGKLPVARMTPANHETIAAAAPMTTLPTKPSAKARFWDKIARKYAADPIEDMAGYEGTLARTQALLSPAQRVLEIGCGTGSTALRLAPSTGQFVATDVSAAMITIAREKLAAAPQSNLAFEVADADAPAGHGLYDVVLAFNVLHLVADLDAALASAAAALAPGGLLISKTACISEMNVLVPTLLLPLMRLVGKAPPVLCFAAPALEAAIARHGFEIVAVERHGTKGKDIRVFIVARKRG
jgi:ubiquinone/menaquinone biosynthesis C-methylase UbiE